MNNFEQLQNINLLSEKLISSNIKDILYTDILNYIEYAKNIEINFANIIKDLESIKKNIKLNFTKIKDKLNINIKESYKEKVLSTAKSKVQFGDYEFETPLITNRREAVRYPNIPCSIQGVKSFIIIYFDKLDFTIAISLKMRRIFDYQESTKFTKVHLHLYNDEIPLNIHNNTYSIFPFDEITWRFFDKKKPEEYDNLFQELIILPNQNDPKNNKISPQKLALNGAYGFNELSDIPEQELVYNKQIMAVNYFLLYLYNLKAKTTK